MGMLRARTTVWAVILALGLMGQVWAKSATRADSPDTESMFGSDDGLAVISAALNSRYREASLSDCSHLVHSIYEQAGFPYSYVSSSTVYRGDSSFRRVKYPHTGDLVAWPGHLGIVVNPAQRSFYSALRSGPGIDYYDAPYWKARGPARFYRYVKNASRAER